MEQQNKTLKALPLGKITLDKEGRGYRKKTGSRVKTGLGLLWSRPLDKSGWERKQKLEVQPRAEPTGHDRSDNRHQSSPSNGNAAAQSRHRPSQKQPVKPGLWLSEG